MDDAARHVLKTCKGEIKENLILNDKILDYLVDHKIFDDEMVQNIQIKPTQNEKITQLLWTLQRRGPGAFSGFLEALKFDHHFLAETLETKYQTEKDRSDSSSSNSDTADSVINTTDNVIANHITTNGFHSNPNNSNRNHNNDKNNNLDIEDTYKSYKSDKSNISISMETTLNITNLYTKVKSRMTNTSLRELSFKSPEPVTMAMLGDLVNELLETVDSCYKVLGTKERGSLQTHLINLKESKRKLRQELHDKEEQRNKYADNFIKLENTCRAYQRNIKGLEKTNDRIKTEVKELKIENKELTEMNKEMAEQLAEQSQELINVTEQLTEAEECIREMKEIAHVKTKPRHESVVQQSKFDKVSHDIQNENIDRSWLKNGTRMKQFSSSLGASSSIKTKNNIDTKTIDTKAVDTKTFSPANPSRSISETNALDNITEETERLCESINDTIKKCDKELAMSTQTKRPNQTKGKAQPPKRKIIQRRYSLPNQKTNLGNSVQGFPANLRHVQTMPLLGLSITNSKK